MHNHTGQLGLGIAYSHDGTTSELIFDHRTGELLGEQGTNRSGTLSYWASYLRERVVSQLPAASPLPLTPPCIATTGTVHHTARGDVMTGFPKGSGSASGLTPVPRSNP